MKLWQKIVLPTLALLVLCTAVVSILLLRNTREALWDREGQRAVTQHQYLAGMLRAGVLSTRLQAGTVQLEESQTRETAGRVLAQQALDSYLTGIVLLDSEGKTLYDQMPEELGPMPEAPEDNPDDAVCTLRAGAGAGDWYLLCSMPVTLESLRCRLGAAYYVGDLQRQMTREAAITVTLCLGISLAGACLLLYLVWSLLRPLAALNASADRIAGGHYDERLPVKGNDELADLAAEMNCLAEAVQDRVSRLEQVAEERKIFIGNLAHEMKTPLTSILGFADLLYLPREVPDEQRVEYAQIISEEARRLRTLSGKLMELITLGSSTLPMEPVSLREITEEVSASLAPVMAQAGLTLLVSCPEVSVIMDRELFKSLLYNLLDNGRKASSRGSRLSLAGEVMPGNQVALRVRDFGHGIPPEEIARITEPFYMVDKSRSRKAGGAGLGLALCREITAAHNGTMEITSTVGEGTCVTLTFPLADTAVPEGGEPFHD